MMRRKSILSILAGGAVLAPLFVFGHACEFLVAKLEVKPDRVTLEITADYGGNPMIPDEATAQEAVRNILQVHLGGQVRRLEDLEPLKFEKRSQWDPEAPASFAPAPDGQGHLLLTGIWTWRPHTGRIALAVPDNNPHDVLLWTQDDKLPGKDAKWMLLIEGEKTPEIQVIPKKQVPEPHPVVTVLRWAFLGLMLGWMWKLNHRR